MWGMHDGGMGWWVFGAIWMTVFWVVIFGLIIWVVSQFSGSGRRSGGESPLEIAQRRYASGEITREQFEQLRQDLGSRP